MADFTTNEKKQLLDAASSQVKLHTYLMGLNGQPGFCKTVEDKLGTVTALETRQGKLEGKVQKVIGILIGVGAIAGTSFGLAQLIH